MKKQQPFFARFLENQLSSGEQRRARGGNPEDCLPDLAMTLKAPSDLEDSYGITAPALRDIPEEVIDLFVQTNKFPSDKEDN
jgi:hypothetical protein